MKKLLIILILILSASLVFASEQVILSEWFSNPNPYNLTDMKLSLPSNLTISRGTKTYQEMSITNEYVSDITVKIFSMDSYVYFASDSLVIVIPKTVESKKFIRYTIDIPTDAPLGKHISYLNITSDKGTSVLYPIVINIVEKNKYFWYQASIIVLGIIGIVSLMLRKPKKRRGK